MHSRFKGKGPSKDPSQAPPGKMDRKAFSKLKKKKKAAGEMFYKDEDDLVITPLADKIDANVKDVTYLDRRRRPRHQESKQVELEDDEPVTSSYDALLQSFQLNSMDEARKAAKKRKPDTHHQESDEQPQEKMKSTKKASKRSIPADSSEDSDEAGIDNADADMDVDGDSNEGESNDANSSEDELDRDERLKHEERVERIKKLMDDASDAEAAPEAGDEDGEDMEKSEAIDEVKEGDLFLTHYDRVLTSEELKAVEAFVAGPQRFTEVEKPKKNSSKVHIFEAATVWKDVNASSKLAEVSSTAQFGVRGNVVFSWNKMFDEMLSSSMEPSKQSSIVNGAPLMTIAQQELFSLLNGYVDVYYGLRTPLNSLEIMSIYTLHVANHLTKSLERKKHHNWEIHSMAVRKRKYKTEITAIKKAMDQKKENKKNKSGNTEKNGAVENEKASSKKSKPVLSNHVPGDDDASPEIEIPIDLVDKPMEELVTRIKELHQLLKEEEGDFRDQGFTVPKVLVLLPMRNSALEFIELLSKVMPRGMAAEVPGRKKFYGEYFDDVYQPRASRPLEWLATFRGNTDDTFRMGITFQRKTMQLYSGFYNSDIIVASPLGLRLAVEEKEQGATDFLSSLELVIVDQTDVMLMQNWEHVQWVFEHMSQLPAVNRKEFDFGRVRPYFLNRQAHYYRQTIVLSSVLNVDINALFNRQCQNAFGRYKIKPSNEFGTVEQIMVSPGTLKQIFFRLEVDDAQAVDDARYTYFTTQVWEHLSAGGNDGTLIITPSYFDYLRVRKFFKNAVQQDSINVVAVSEYTSESGARKSRKHFFDKKAHIMLMTERYHFYTRSKVRGIKSIIFYSPPLFPQLYSELANWVDEGGSILTIYSKYDSLSLEGVVGRERCELMLISEKTTHSIAL